MVFAPGHPFRLSLGREALVLQLYYVEELNLFEIAAVLDVTSGRVSQIKSSAFKKMQPLLKDYIDNSQAA